jgi:hypothetical protein
MEGKKSGREYFVLAETQNLLKCEAIPVTGRGGPLGCETSRLPHFPDNRLIDGGDVVSLTLLDVRKWRRGERERESHRTAAGNRKPVVH